MHAHIYKEKAGMINNTIVILLIKMMTFSWNKVQNNQGRSLHSEKLVYNSVDKTCELFPPFPGQSWTLILQLEHYKVVEKI